MHCRSSIRTSLIVLASSLALVGSAAAQGVRDELADISEEEALAKQSQNPVANLISLPFQNNTTFGVGPSDAVVNTFNIQPIYPIGAGKFTIINRFILPVTYQGEVVPGGGTEFGLGDLSYTAFVSPAKASKITWGIGPSFVIPTATADRLGSGKWSAGIGIVALMMPGRWVVGGLVQNTWSFAGDENRAGVNFFFSQYFVTYVLPSKLYFTSSPIITANWEAESGQQWTVPLGGGLGKLVKVGKTPVDLQVQAFYHVVKPDFAGDWSTRLQFKLLFPK